MYTPPSADTEWLSEKRIVGISYRMLIREVVGRSWQGPGKVLGRSWGGRGKVVEKVGYLQSKVVMNLGLLGALGEPKFPQNLKNNKKQNKT